eukprot:CAMPEP_0206269926 /NCGR_PEP_ID=MMETSP0047_2-20121206/32581_1 /ASSEMBLY_ACC=CAM_ASM_000192 /TAXON_ID=195065 /ORGANISM="Chroomonas mesostigmatica_cf, Strain CCMP1168" /LENGTH=53 /DNA_ID=CAMNT_0053698505 /DNA_START=76 /DNA_END=233 /DNA_ORIENTATION=+
MWMYLTHRLGSHECLMNLAQFPFSLPSETMMLSFLAVADSTKPRKTSLSQYSG